MFMVMMMMTYFVEARILQENAERLLRLQTFGGVVDDDDLVVQVVRRVHHDRRQRQLHVVDVVAAEVRHDRQPHVGHFHSRELVRVVATSHWTRVGHQFQQARYRRCVTVSNAARLQPNTPSSILHYTPCLGKTKCQLIFCSVCREERALQTGPG